MQLIIPALASLRWISGGRLQGGSGVVGFCSVPPTP